MACPLFSLPEVCVVLHISTYFIVDAHDGHNSSVWSYGSLQFCHADQTIAVDRQVCDIMAPHLQPAAAVQHAFVCHTGPTWFSQAGRCTLCNPAVSNNDMFPVHVGMQCCRRHLEFKTAVPSWIWHKQHIQTASTLLLHEQERDS